MELEGDLLGPPRHFKDLPGAQPHAAAHSSALHEFRIYRRDRPGRERLNAALKKFGATCFGHSEATPDRPCADRPRSKRADWPHQLISRICGQREAEFRASNSGLGCALRQQGIRCSAVPFETGRHGSCAYLTSALPPSPGTDSHRGPRLEA